MAEKKDKISVKKTGDLKKTAKNDSSKKSNTEKKSLWARFMIFCNGVKSEFSKIHWSNKSDMLKYSIATIVFVIFFSLFFYAIELLMALLKSLV